MRNFVALFGVLLLVAAIGIPALLAIVLFGYLIKGNN